MADKTVKEEAKKKPSFKPEKKDYTLIAPLRKGSKRNGEPKKAYKAGSKISLTAKEAKLYLKLKLI